MAYRDFIFKCTVSGGYDPKLVSNGYFEITPVSGVVDVVRTKDTCTVLCQYDAVTKKYATAKVRFFPAAGTRHYDIYSVWEYAGTTHRDLIGEFDYNEFLIGDGGATADFRNGGEFEFRYKPIASESLYHTYGIYSQNFGTKYIFFNAGYKYVRKIYARAVVNQVNNDGSLSKKAYLWHEVFGAGKVNFQESGSAGDPYVGPVIICGGMGTLVPQLTVIANAQLEFYFDVDNGYCVTAYGSPENPFVVYEDGALQTPSFALTLVDQVRGVDVTLNFDANGGTDLSFNSKVCEFGMFADDLPTANLKGHTLSGWKSGSLNLARDTRITWIDTKTFLAQWAALPPGVLHIILGSGIASAAYLLESASDWVSVNANTDVSVPAETSAKVFAIPSRGYIYEHWNKDTALSVQLASEAEETFSPVGAAFEGEVQVFLNPCGGELDFSKIIKHLAVGADYEPLEEPTYAGYDFIGWFDKEEGGEQIGEYVMRSDDHEIFAHWEELPAPPEKVYFNPVGGVCATEYVERDVNTAIGTLPSATKDGYRFVGWFTKVFIGEQVLPTTKVPDLGMTVYARWEKI